MSGEARMTFLEHLEELRSRLIKCAIALAVGFIACYAFKEELLEFMVAPFFEAWGKVDGLPDPQLNFASPIEPFMAYLKLAAVGGVFVASPVILYQLWAFVSPGLYPREKRLALPFVFSSTLLFVGGSALAYSLVFPVAFQYFLEFSGPIGGYVVKTSSTVSGDGVVTARPVPADATDEALAWMKRKLTRKCETFSALPAGASKGVTLEYRWHESGCGPAPTVGALSRDGRRIVREWSRAQGPPGYDVLTTADATAGAGTHTWALVVSRGRLAQQLAPVIMMKDYLSLAVQLLIGFGVVFELPIFITFLSMAGIVTHRHLLRFARYFIVIAFFVAAVLTPGPDVFSQLCMAIPLVVLYFLSVFVAYLFTRRRERRESASGG
ncbi:MAG: twin-arginine translocase subunit TatC [Deltaproteobacteria bacterium]|nr:twin-arginine translocase subunit TatC [Deltaproteobacteria bacterium]